MREVAANTRRSLNASNAVFMGLRMLVAEGNVAVHEIADRLHAWPASGVLENSFHAMSLKRSVSQ